MSALARSQQLSQGHLSGEATTRPSEVPKRDFWPASMTGFPSTGGAALRAIGHPRCGAERHTRDYPLDGDFSTTIWERFGEAPENGDRSMSQKPVLGANFQFAEDLPNDLRDTRSVGAYRGSQPTATLHSVDITEYQCW